MTNPKIRIQVGLLFSLILLNFLAQIPYFFHLYYKRQPVLESLRSAGVMGLVFLGFMTASILLFRKRRSGYWLMILFVSAEFSFYWRGVLAGVQHHFGWFFQMANPDPVLRVIYSIGYVNLFAAGYFLLLLILKRHAFLGPIKNGSGALSH